MFRGRRHPVDARAHLDGVELRGALEPVLLAHGERHDDEDFPAAHAAGIRLVFRAHW